MRYDFVDFQLIANIYEAGTITKGAEASHITLASASERVRGMEMELGTELFIRGRRGVNFTKAGFIVLHHARLMLSQMKQMIIHGGKPLQGDIWIGGAKNSTVAQIPASILSRTPVTLESVPRIADVDNLMDLLSEMDVHCDFRETTLQIDRPKSR